MKLRKLRKKTRPTQKKEVLFPYENRLEALKGAVDSLNNFQYYIEKLAEAMQRKATELDGWNDIKCWVNESDPTLIHFTGIPKVPVERIVVECTVSEQRNE